MAYAIVNDTVVTNVVEWDGNSDWSPDFGVAIEITDPVGIGWLYENGKFSPPKNAQPSRDENIQAAKQEINARIDAATVKISIWQTKLLIGRKLTDEETAQLNTWMDYIDAVNAINPESETITWPVIPE